VINLLLIPYHRDYDGVLLLFPLALGIFLVKNNLSNYGKIILFCLIPFLFPLSAIITYFLKIYGYQFLLNISWFETMILAHRTWLLIIMSIIMIKLMSLDYRHRLIQVGNI
jgi:hypothetical protein